jgi:hypothetical protein
MKSPREPAVRGDGEFGFRLRREAAVVSEAGLTIHATKKVLARVKQPIVEAAVPASALGNWYANALFWEPQVALFVNKRTLLPVFMELGLASTLAECFPAELRKVLHAHNIVHPAQIVADAEVVQVRVGPEGPPRGSVHFLCECWWCC